jgi:uncharacterized protein YjbI with pentapeptide repeats
MFLGKIYLESGGKRFAVKADGNLAMLSLSPDDPAGMFLAYQKGTNSFALQCHTGQWVQLSAAQSEIAWYQVLYAANVGYNPTSFSLQFFRPASRRVKLAFVGGASAEGAAAAGVDNGQVALLMSTGLNPYCRCEFDVATGWGYGVDFGMGVMAPGVPDIQTSKSGFGANFGCIGKACVDLSQVNFTDVDFRDARFDGANLSGTVFSGCRLAGAKFAGSNLAATDFRTSSIAGANFSAADLTQGTVLPEPPFATDPASRTILRQAKVPAALLKKNWSYLDLTGAEIIGLDNADLSGLVARYLIAPGLNLSGRVLLNADFSYADLTSSHFRSARLNKAVFYSSTLGDCFFSGAILRSARFDPDPTLQGSPATDLTGARFSSAMLDDVSFENAMLLATVFTGANMNRVNLTGAQLGGLDRSAAASLSYAYLANAKLDKANLFGVNFAQATLFGAATSVTQTVTLEQADFSNAYLSGISFAGADLKGAKFTGACLVNVRFTDVDLRPAAAGSIVSSLAGSTLQGADFTGARLNYADLSNAAVSFANGEIPVRYCDEDGVPFPEPPDSLPLRFMETRALDLETLGQESKCPNGFTVAENVAAGKTLRQMLTSANARDSWFPAKCGPSLAQQEQEGFPFRRRKAVTSE